MPQLRIRELAAISSSLCPRNTQSRRSTVARIGVDWLRTNATRDEPCHDSVYMEGFENVVFHRVGAKLPFPRLAGATFGSTRSGQSGNCFTRHPNSATRSFYVALYRYDTAFNRDVAEMGAIVESVQAVTQLCWNLPAGPDKIERIVEIIKDGKKLAAYRRDVIGASFSKNKTATNYTKTQLDNCMANFDDKQVAFVNAKRQALEELPDNQRIPTNDVINKIALVYDNEYQVVKHYFMNKASARDRQAAGKKTRSVVAPPNQGAKRIPDSSPPLPSTMTTPREPLYPLLPAFYAWPRFEWSSMREPLATLIQASLGGRGNVAYTRAR